MGRGIAILLAEKGINVVVVEKTAAEIKEIQSLMEKGISDYCKSDKVKHESILNNISISDNYEKIRMADIIIEAVCEDFALKMEVYGRVENLCATNTIIATNTSSLDIEKLSMGLKNKTRFLGIHFINPVLSMKLIEVSRTSQTEDKYVDNIINLGERLGRKIILINGVPGYVVNRLLFAMINEAFILLESNVASARDIDYCMRYGANHLMGPLALADLIGLDVCLDILGNLYGVKSETKYQSSKLLQKYVGEGKLGKKSGEGIYKY